MKKRILSLVAGLVLMASACDVQNTLDHDKSKDTSLESNTEEHRKYLLESAGESDGPFSITTVSIAEGSVLNVEVQHPTGCTGDFDFFWDGSVAYSYPPQVYLVLTHDGSCEGSDFTESTTLTLDLKDFLDDTELAQNATVHVINGSLEYSSNDKNVASKK